jgi:hypothetical protein
VVNRVVDHLWSDVHTEQTNSKDTEAVPDEAERNDKSDQHESAPRALEEHVRGEETGDEQDQARADSAAFLRHLDDDSRKLKKRAFTQIRCARNLK